MLIDCTELAIFASFLRRTITKSRVLKQEAKKVHERPETKNLRLVNILRPRLGRMHSLSAECNNDIMSLGKKKKKKKKTFILTTILTVFSHAIKKTVVFSNNNSVPIGGSESDLLTLPKKKENISLSSLIVPFFREMCQGMLMHALFFRVLVKLCSFESEAAAFPVY